MRKRAQTEWDILVAFNVPLNLFFHAGWNTVKHKLHGGGVGALDDGGGQRGVVPCRREVKIWNASTKANLPDGHVGLCKAQVCTISEGGVRETYLPFTPPPKRT